MPHQKFDIPPVRPDDEPIVCVPVNAEWIGWLIGMLYIYRYPEHWGGTLEENRQVRLDVMHLIDILIDARDCDMNCCDGSDLIISTMYRVNNNGSSEISIDNGVTWNANPNDPRTSFPALPAITSTTGHNKCDGATNAVEHLKDVQAGIANIMTQSISVLDFLVAVLEVIFDALLISLGAGGAATLVPVVGQFLRSLYGHAREDYDALFTNEVWDAVTCILYCNISENGTFTQTQFDHILEQCLTKIPGGVCDFCATKCIQAMIATWGLQGLNRAASFGAAALSDCSACDCGSCDLANWQLRNVNAGHTRISGTDEIGAYVGATSDDGGNGNFYVILSTQDAATCCFINSFAALPGEFADGLVTVIPCGLEQIEGNKVNIGSTPSRCVNLCQAQSAQPFTIKFYLGSC